MNIEDLVMIGLTGIAIAIGYHYDKNKPFIATHTQEQQASKGLGRGYISNGYITYALINGEVREVKKW